MTESTETSILFFAAGATLLTLLVILSLIYSRRPYVDPWELQRSVMKCSSQEVPATPMLTLTSLTYAALICEELSEKLTHLYGIVAVQPDNLSPDIYGKVDGYLALVRSEAERMSLAASDMRVRLAQLKDLGWDPKTSLTRAEAIALLDDTTDIAVVTSGFACATGLPGAEAFLEVSRSNLSKAGPDGRIAVDLSGKWIKGPRYTPPDLGAVLERQWRRVRGGYHSDDAL